MISHERVYGIARAIHLKVSRDAAYVRHANEIPADGGTPRLVCLRLPAIAAGERIEVCGPVAQIVSMHG
jgi:hypothetical protein